jgi:hypothetical protein
MNTSLLDSRTYVIGITNTVVNAIALNPFKSGFEVAEFYESLSTRKLGTCL